MANVAPGYSDTPFLPGNKWRVHDSSRPQPRIVTPTNIGQLAPVAPPSDAVVLFDGSSLAGWEKAKTGEAAGWKLVDGSGMEVVPKTGNIRTKRALGDGQYHIEWAAPAEVKGESQGRGNSGVFLLGIYEIQVLDCYDNPTYADGTTAAVYGQFPPMVNACVPPGAWHVYDIIWRGPRFDGDKLAEPAVVTVLHNGVVVHHARQLIGATCHKQVGVYQPHPPTGPLELQDHGDLVRFRNIWFRDVKACNDVV